MTTYKTYQEAKIANPERDIYTDGELFCGSLIARHYFGMKKCNPVDYCMTVEKFSADGHKFVGGDVLLGRGGQVIAVEHPSIADWNGSSVHHNNRFVLRAKALEQPKHTKVEYVKVDYGNEHYSAGCELFMGKQLFVLAKDGKYYPIKHQAQAVKASQDGIIYEKVTTELTEREVFIEEAIKVMGFHANDMSKDYIGKLFDSGKFKLVEGK